MIKNIKQNLLWQEGGTLLIKIAVLIAMAFLIKSTVFSIFCLIVIWFSFYFFRNPDRLLPEIDSLDIISPSDGKVIDIAYNLDNPEYAQKISIFLSPLDVHVNWIPIDGEIEKVEYKSGTFAFAFTPKSSELNERNDIVIKDNKSRKVLVRQIAGTIARKIVCWIKNKEQVKLGQKYGMIKFGSRVEIFLPKDVEIKVKLSDRVIGGKTIIGKWLC